jgi:uncharacterized protein (UPF0333 family)
MEISLLFSFILGILVLVAIGGTYTHTKKTAKLLEVTNLYLKQLVELMDKKSN